MKDPELNLNIIDIGLVYDIDVTGSGDVLVKMTLTFQGVELATFEDRITLE